MSGTVSIPPGLAGIGNQLTNTGADLSTSVINVIQGLRHEMQNSDHFPYLIDEDLDPFLGHLIDDFNFLRVRWQDLGAMLIDVATTMQDLDTQQLGQFFNPNNWQSM